MVLQHECDSLLYFSIGYEIILFYLFVGHVKLNLKFYERNLAQKHFVNIMPISLQQNHCSPVWKKEKKKIKC